METIGKRRVRQIRCQHQLLSEKIMFNSAALYAKRVARMTTFWADGTVGWSSYKMGLRPNQIAVLASNGGFVFCRMPCKPSAV